ncbi:MAG: carbamoyl-phosphate synthase (glutamine-hydrolyzing) large subunit [bacterium]
MPKNTQIKKVLVIGSGPIVIGQAAEFDYAGVQACRALKEENIEVILVNSNPATIMTDETIADKVYIQPLTVAALKYIIKKERPDGLIASLGGQTGLNLAVQLNDTGILKRYRVKVLGTNIDSIKKAEDRELFKNLMQQIGEPVPDSAIVSNYEDALKFAEKIGYPIIIRPAYTLGGSGGGIAQNQNEYEEIVHSGLAMSPINQILVEKSIAGFKEVEYEVMRDGNDTCIIVCNMENIDPIGIHTGDSFVVAPSQTLTNKEYQMLRSSSLKIIRALEIEGGCNVQYALDTVSNQYYVIEVNPRVSRSSALASKATGYPIARVTTKIAVGYNLHEIKNAITGKTVAAFEPSIDYVVTKIPKWPFDKFSYGDRILGTKMKATGEVMAIGRTFESSFKKAITSTEDKQTGLLNYKFSKVTTDQLIVDLNIQDDRRIFRLAEALQRGVTIDQINKITKIDRWFIHKIKNLVDFGENLKTAELTPELYLKAKEMGFLDEEIADLKDKKLSEIQKIRKTNKIQASFKIVDTCAAEFEAQTPYYYSTYGEECELKKTSEKETIMVLGSGPIRIGQGIEFDYCSVHAAWSIKNNGYDSVMVNSNPETLSTDFDIADRLYFEPMNIENIMNIVEKEKPKGVLVQFGGQTAINLAEKLQKRGVKILGTSLESIDLTEDRELFGKLLTELEIPQPRGKGVRTLVEAIEAAKEIGYPILVRPSYVIGGRGMQVVYNDDELVTYINEAIKFSDNIILIDQYIEGHEVELDAISDGIDILVPGINEHIERAGVHSGDSISVYPAQHIDKKIVAKLMEYTKKIATSLQTKGLMNIQFIIKDNVPYVIEVNPRASRTVPIMSKVTNIPMVDIAVNVILGKSIKKQGYKPGLAKETSLVCVKVPIFSFQKLNRIDPALAPEMKSTGEVLGIDKNYEKALIKAFIAAGYKFPMNKQRILVSLNDHYKNPALEVVRGFFNAGFLIMATWGTHKFLEKNGVPSKMIEKFMFDKLQKRMKEGRLSLVINTPTLGKDSERRGFKIRTIAEMYSIPCFTSIDTARAFLQAVNAYDNDPKLKYKSIEKYRKKKFFNWF